MAACDFIRRVKRHGVSLFIWGLFTLCVPWGTAQMQRPLKLNLPDSPVVRYTEPAQANAEIVQAALAQLTAPTVLKIAGDVYEYNYILPTGVGRYHSVGVHRVVRVQNGKTAAGHNAVFLAHGSQGSFDIDFMNAAQPTHSLAVYLASNGVDVWGIDYGWALVPLSETDFTFMQNWGLQRDIDDLEAAILLARIIRAETGNDGGRFPLLGFSYSGWTGFALVNQEAKRSCQTRQVRAFIPVDLPFLSNDPSLQSGACAGEAAYHQYWEQGFYDDDSGSSYQTIGILAQTDPNGLSPVLPPYTNSQSSLVLGAAPWLFGGIIPASAHYVAGIFGPGGINSIPVGFQYVDVSAWNKALASLTPYQPMLEGAEMNAVTCGDGNSSYSNSLRLVKVPVFYVGAAGGEGNLGLYTLTQLGSQDIQHYVVSFYPPDQAALDYGHDDLMGANNAQEVVWSRILDWLNDHLEDTSCSE